MHAHRLWAVALLIGGLRSASCSGAGVSVRELLPTLARRAASGLSAAALSLDSERRTLRHYRRRLEWGGPEESARRQAHVPRGGGGFIYAVTQRTARKACDCMLQTVFMARHKYRELESDKHFGRTDTAYRIAFSTKRLVKMMEKLTYIYQTMLDRKSAWEDLRPSLVLHHKAARLHLDFLHLWWVLARLDGAFRQSKADEDNSEESEDRE